MTKRKTSPIARISMSMPQDLLDGIDGMVAGRGFESRSQAINETLYQALTDYRAEQGQEVVVGVITLCYDNGARGLHKNLAKIQIQHLDEVISSLHVQLAHNETMQVILVQGHAAKLRTITNELSSCRGVKSGHIHLVSALIPQVLPFSKKGGTHVTDGQHTEEDVQEP